MVVPAQGSGSSRDIPAFKQELFRNKAIEKFTENANATEVRRYKIRYATQSKKRATPLCCCVIQESLSLNNSAISAACRTSSTGLWPPWPSSTTSSSSATFWILCADSDLPVQAATFWGQSHFQSQLSPSLTKSYQNSAKLNICCTCKDCHLKVAVHDTPLRHTHRPSSDAGALSLF